MYPEKSARQVPLLESTALSKPRGRFPRMDSPGNDMIFRCVRRRDPTSGEILQLVTWGAVHPPHYVEWVIRRTFHFVNFVRELLHLD